MIYITNENDIMNKEGYSCLFFYFSSIPQLNQLKKMISKIENKYTDFQFYAVDTDFFKSLIVKYKVTCVPTYLFFKNNKCFKKVEGLMLTSAFKKIFNDIYNKKKDEINEKS